MAGRPLGGWRIRPMPSLLAEPSRPRDIILGCGGGRLLSFWWRGRWWSVGGGVAGRRMKAPEMGSWAGAGVPGTC